MTMNKHEPGTLVSVTVTVKLPGWVNTDIAASKALRLLNEKIGEHAMIGVPSRYDSSTDVEWIDADGQIVDYNPAK
jgi:hypothetical protein